MSRFGNYEEALKDLDCRSGNYKKKRLRNNNLKAIAAMVIVGLVIVGLVYLDYNIWELQHPNAPKWTYIFKGK